MANGREANIQVSIGSKYQTLVYVFLISSSLKTNPNWGWRNGSSAVKDMY